jgi:hypothetical protein
MVMDRDYKFEVALSFAGEDCPYASKLASILRRRGINVFFDEYEKYSSLLKKSLLSLPEKTWAKQCATLP